MSDPCNEAFIAALNAVTVAQRRGAYGVPLEVAIRRATFELLAALECGETRPEVLVKVADKAADGDSPFIRPDTAQSDRTSHA